MCLSWGKWHTLGVCVCTIHQSVELMFLGASLSELFAANSISLPTYHQCLAKILCDPPLPICYLGECAICPGIPKFKDDLAILLDENLINDIHLIVGVS